MAREDEIIKERMKKIEEMRKAKIEPYPYKFDKKDSALSLQEQYKKLENEKFGKSAVAAGRVMSIRNMGKIAFVALHDDSGKIQIVLQEGETPKKQMDLFNKYVDTGDFIGVSGKIFRTKRGELSILAEKIEILTKSIKPLPTEYFGLQDKEERYRKRYLDLTLKPEVKKVFDKREKILEAIREFLKQRDFHEVDTPYLQTVYGGAAAKPFETHLNALDIDLFLAISPELYLKRLIVGGYEKVFTIARNFRNEGIDKWHNPEFTMMELYQAYTDYNDMMKITEDLFEYVAKKVNGTTKVKFKEKEIDFKAPWKRMTMAEAIKKWAKIDVMKMKEKDLIDFANKNGCELKGKNWGHAMQAIFEKFCEKEIEQPTFITDHPIESTPLCKQLRNGDKRLIERFEPFCMGTELANAYSELNDPVLQRKLLEEQQAMLKEGNGEANPYDEDFVNAIEIGMPPTGGLGIGIDRMIILMTEQESIRDIILFPFMKPLK
jgi:lysyl-tRNA synthetase, class II